MTRRGARILAGVGFGLVLAAGLAPPVASAQSVEARLVQRRLEYRAARSAWESARNAAAVIEAEFAAALEASERARRAGDEDARERALANVQARSGPVRSQSERVEDALAALNAARDALIRIITVRMEQLVSAMAGASSARERTRLDVLFRDLDNELQALEDEAGDALRFRPVVMPEVTFDPRDGPEDLRAKAELLERRAAMADSTIAEVDGDIRDLTDRLRNQRRLADFMAGTDRFDDTRLPVVGGSRPGDAPATPADSAAAGRRPATLEERIRGLQRAREQLEIYRDQLLVQARLFRQAIGFIT